MEDILLNYLKPELLMLIAIVWIVEDMLRKFVKNKQYVTFEAYIISDLLCGIWEFSASSAETIKEILRVLFTSLTQGSLVIMACALIKSQIRDIANSQNLCDCDDKEEKKKKKENKK
jgi:hypothetical protein